MPLLPLKSTQQMALLALVAAVVGLITIPRESFWMDEGSSAFKALMPSLGEWWQMTLRIGGSDVQMPVYMFLLWGWHQLGAVSEYALRAVNLPWLILAVLALRRVPWWSLVCLTSPFVLYYTGELRPYAMQIAGGALAAAAMMKVSASREDGLEGLHATACASILLVASSLTAVVWSAGLWTGVLLMRPDWLRRKGFWIGVAPWACGALVIGGYYVFTLLEGYRASGFGGGGLLNIGFAFYELIGLLGLGPGRDELRNSASAIIPALPILIPALACTVVAWCCGVASWFRASSRRNVAGVVCAVMLPILVLAAVGWLMDFRVLGRHFSPIVPAVLLPVAAAVSGEGPYPRLARVSGVLAVFVALVSAVSLIRAERHARDDYRRAAGIAIESLKAGRSIWWKADMNATRYYVYREGGMAYINAIQIMESEPPSSLMFADVVVINRPDLHFKGVDYQKELRRQWFELEAKFTGFEVWRAR